MVVWWNQPWFGWRFCLLEGFVPETYMLERLRPEIIRRLEREWTYWQKNRKNYNSDRYVWPQGITLEEALYTVNRAFDLLTECISKRWNIKYCRRAGREEESGSAFKELIFYYPDDEYIVESSDIEIGITYTNIGDGRLYIKNYNTGFIVYETICDPRECDCNVLHDG